MNVPDGANLLSNTSGTLVGVVLAPVTWLFGPDRRHQRRAHPRPGAQRVGLLRRAPPARDVEARCHPGRRSCSATRRPIVTSLVFGHVSVTFLVLPPLLFTTLHEIVIRQEHSVRRDGLVLAALLVAQFLISPEVLVMCLLFAVVGLRRGGGGRLAPGAGALPAMPCPALGLAPGVAVVLLAYPAWFGLAGPQAVTGVLFALAPDLGRAALGCPVAGAVRGVRPRVRPLRGLPGPQRATARLRRRRGALAARWSAVVVAPPPRP